MSDLVIVLICLISLFRGYKFKVSNLFIICVFSLLFSLSFFKLPGIFIGTLYLIRLVTYFVFSQIVYRQFGTKEKKRKLIFDSLILVGIFIAIFGWIQYFIFPDLRALKAFQWDDHYFRLVSTFLDPAFTGILLVLAEILIFIKTVKSETRLNYFLNIFLITTVLFTYSRASYLALLFAFVFLFIKFRRKFLLILIILFLLLVPLLPKQTGGEGVNLTRTYSIFGRIENYRESLILISKSPVFGIGFDNVCVAKNKFLGEGNFVSHSCSGLDNSILFIFATTGIIGLIIFTHSISRIVNKTTQDLYGVALIASFVAIFVHGMFTNTFFYNFVLGWIAILIGITRKVKD